jgi:adenosylhomocysteine nucleosidase
MLLWKIKRAFIIALICLCLSLTATQVSAVKRKNKICLTECQPRMGIVSAFGQEADILLAETTNKYQYNLNGNIFTTGSLRDNKVVIL